MFVNPSAHSSRTVKRILIKLNICGEEKTVLAVTFCDGDHESYHIPDEERALLLIPYETAS
jgi:hypothetical protein